MSDDPETAKPQPRVAVAPVAFLGVCERGQEGFEGGRQVLRFHHIMGLKKHVISPVYPCLLQPLQLVLAYHNLSEIGAQTVIVRGIDGAEVFQVNLKPPAQSKDLVQHDPATGAVRADYRGWTIILGDAGTWSFPLPGRYEFYAVVDGIEVPIGGLEFVLLNHPPMTDDRRAALRSHPAARDFVQLDLACRNCGGALEAYTALKRSPEHEAKGVIWYEDLPDSYVCPCGTMKTDLTILRAQMHALLEPHSMAGGNLSLNRMYERHGITVAVGRYTALLDTFKREEELQVFLQDNPLLLCCFTATRIIPKAPILNKYVTDFAILNNKRELVLVEIEKSSTKLLNKNGDTSAELQHAIDQVDRWIHTLNQDRRTTLDCMGITEAEVGAIKGVVIAGRYRDYNQKDMHRLRARDLGPISIMTYDDLALGVEALLESIETL